MAHIAVDFLLENLKQLMNHEQIYNLFSEAGKLQLGTLCRELNMMRTFLKDSESSWYGHKEVRDLVDEIRDLAYEAEDIIDSFILDRITKAKKVIGGLFIPVYGAPRPRISYQTLTIGAIMRKKRGIVRKIDRIFHPPRTLGDVLKEIKSIKKEVSEIYERKLYGFGDPCQEVGMASSGRTSRAISLNIENETVVGFDQEVETIKERLAGGSKRLDVISIVGMPGLGKTTLAKKLYNDSFVVYHFYVRGWTYVSQVYAKRDLLLGILSSVVEHIDGLYTMSDEKLGEELYKRLKGKRYLLVMDDIWNTKAWDDMRIYFPNDNNGSRIVITSRLTEIGLHAKPDSDPHFLHFLSGDESWDLLRQKVFGKEKSCPPDLVGVGKQIAKKCQGLPLAIVVVAGVLAKIGVVQDQWREVAESLSSHIASDPEECMETLALSYNHLPPHLKFCFLYFGAFPEDCEIPVRKLIWLWIAEGFIRQIGQKTLEDVAEEYLIDLIDRSLVLVAKRKSDGGISACRIHDLLRDLCLRKGKEENFLQQIYRDQTLPSHSSYPMTNKQHFLIHLSRFFNLSHPSCLKKAKIPENENTKYEQASSSYSAKKENSLHRDSEYDQTSSPSSCLIPIGRKERHLSILSHNLKYISWKPSAVHIRSILCFTLEQSPLIPTNISCIYEAFKLLRVLDLSVINLPDFPSQIVQLIFLRYLALQGKRLTLPASISNISNLETLVISQAITVIVPADIWRMVKLRHLQIAGASYNTPPQWLHSISHNVQTISQLSPDWSGKLILARTPNLRKLGFCGNLITKEGSLRFPELDFLNHLEALKLLNRTFYEVPLPGKRCSLQGLKFPPNLRRLTLSRTNLDWEEMSTLGLLCNLEVLKLEFLACVGPRWETSSGGFRRLKFLRFYYIGIEHWEASSIHFPSLERLVLHRCEKLDGIPFEFGNLSTLQTIEVSWCSQSAAISARKIQEEQQNLGNDWLKIIVNPPEW